MMTMLRSFIGILLRPGESALHVQLAARSGLAAHIGAYLFVMMDLAAIALVINLAASGLESWIVNPGRAMQQEDMGGMLRVTRRMATLEWWVAPGQTLVALSQGSTNDGMRAPDDVRGWLALAARAASAALVTSARLAWTLARLLVPGSAVRFIAWLAVIAYLDPQVVRAAGTTLHVLMRSVDKLTIMISTVGLCGLLASMLVVVSAPSWYPRRRYQRERQAECLRALDSLVTGCLDAAAEMYRLGLNAEEMLRADLVEFVRRLSAGYCALAANGRVMRLSRPIGRSWVPTSHAATLDPARLGRLAAGVDRDLEQLLARGMGSQLRGLLGRPGLWRLCGLGPATRWKWNIEQLLGDKIVDDRTTQCLADEFSRAARLPVGRRDAALEAARADLDEFVARISVERRRRLASLAWDISQAERIGSGLARRLRLGSVAQLLLAVSGQR